MQTLLLIVTLILTTIKNGSYVREYRRRNYRPRSELQARRARATPEPKTFVRRHAEKVLQGTSRRSVRYDARHASTMRHKTTVKVSIFFALGISLINSFPTWAETEDPALILQDIIDDFETIWLPLNQDPEASYDSRRAWATLLVDDRFDLDQMARSSLGTRWRTLSVNQQAEYSPLFRLIIIETVIDWLDGYKGGKFDVGRVQHRGRNTEIQTVFVETDGQTFRLTWVTRANGGIYQFRDVRFSGLSLVADFRGKYQRTLDEKGFDGLVRRLMDDTDRLQKKQT